MIRNIDHYLDTARENALFRSDRGLAIALHVTSTTISAYRKRKSYPSDTNMVKLARLAGLNPEIAVVELSAWRCASNNDNMAAQVWVSISRRLRDAMLALLIALPLSALHTGAQAAGALDFGPGQIAHRVTCDAPELSLMRQNAMLVGVGDLPYFSAITIPCPGSLSS